MYIRMWLLANRIRRFFGYPSQPKRCCRKPENLLAFSSQAEQGFKEVVRKCRVCGCRHFEVEAEPGRFGITGGAVGR